MAVIKGMVIGIVAIFIMAIAITMFVPSLDGIKQSDVLNCNGYVDASDASLSYNSSLNSDTVACIIVGNVNAFYALAVVIGVFLMILYGGSATSLEGSSESY
jgi:hypothetical protein